jgi:hypothetical protein
MLALSEVEVSLFFPIRTKIYKVFFLRKAGLDVAAVME